MNVIIVMENGKMNTPILVKKDTTAQATFNHIAEEMIGDDISEIDLHSDDQVIKLNHIIKKRGMKVYWFENVPVNKYKN